MMTTQLPLEAPTGYFREFNQSRADLLNTAKAQPTFEARLEYFNSNIQSLAVCSPVFVHKVYANWADANLFCTKPNCRCGVKSTPAEAAFYLEARTKEINRLTNELSKRATYGEKVAYLITQPGFSFGRLYFDGIDLSPDLNSPGREPEDIATFNGHTKAEFEKGPKSDWLERWEATLSERLRAAAEPEYEINNYRAQIELFCNYRQPVKDRSHLTEIEQDVQRFMEALDEAADRDHKAKTVCKLLIKGFSWEEIITDFSKNPLYLNDWASLEHGKQVADLYQWLANWQPGEVGTTPEPGTEEKNTFCKAMPVDAAREHFRKLVDKESKNGRPYLTETALEAFIKRAFLGDTTIPKQVINFNPSREKGFIIDVFYGLYQTANEPKKQWEDTPQCRDKYINLLVENFEGWDFERVKNNFRSK